MTKDEYVMGQVEVADAALADAAEKLECAMDGGRPLWGDEGRMGYLWDVWELVNDAVNHMVLAAGAAEFAEMSDDQ